VPKLTESEQRAIIAGRLSDTLNSTDSELRDDREKALDFYYGRPMGNEIEGRAQVVSKDMMDTIEWMMPSFMRIFCTQQAVQFDAVGPEDEIQAKQETGYVSHVLWKKNPGFMTIYEWAKDGLMQKNGYVKYWWQDEEKRQFANYTGLTEEQLVITLQSLGEQGEVEVVGHSADEHGMHDIKVRVTRKYGCAKVECVPPEEVIVDRNCRGNIKAARFVGHLRKNVTRSELIEQGYDKKLVKNLTSYVWNADLSESLARDSVSENLNLNGERQNDDSASDELQLLDCLTYLDADDDGIAELRHYLLAGNEVLENEEFPEINWESWTPIPIPHRHTGLGVYDIMEDIQRIKTALQRGLLDNVYFTMNPRSVYDKNTIDVSMLQINRPGGHIANDGPPGMAIMPMPVAPMAGQLLPVIDYVDTVKETRTGVGRLTQGVDADVLAQSTKGAYQDARGSANQRIEAIARIFAETGLSSLFRSLHGLLTRHQDWPTKFKLRNDWVETNPAEWQERTDLTVSVGLGNASKEEIRANLQLMAIAQEKAGMVPGLIQPTNVFSLFRRMQTELGFENEAFITDPQSPEFKEFMESQKGGKDPFVEGEEIKAQANMAGKQLDASIKREQMAQDRDLKITEMEVDAGVDLAKAGIGAEVAVARGAQQASRNGPAAAAEPGPR
jgi:hypothetical protein